MGIYGASGSGDGENEGGFSWVLVTEEGVITRLGLYEATDEERGTQVLRIPYDFRIAAKSLFWSSYNWALAIACAEFNGLVSRSSRQISGLSPHEKKFRYIASQTPSMRDINDSNSSRNCATFPVWVNFEILPRGSS